MIVQVAKFEFLNKPVGVIAMIYSGVPDIHKEFWREFGVEGIAGLYISMTVVD